MEKQNDGLTWGKVLKGAVYIAGSIAVAALISHGVKDVLEYGIKGLFDGVAHTVTAESQATAINILESVKHTAPISAQAMSAAETEALSKVGSLVMNADSGLTGISAHMISFAVIMASSVTGITDTLLGWMATPFTAVAGLFSSGTEHAANAVSTVLPAADPFAQVNNITSIPLAPVEPGVIQDVFSTSHAPIEAVTGAPATGIDTTAADVMNASAKVASAPPSESIFSGKNLAIAGGSALVGTGLTLAATGGEEKRIERAERKAHGPFSARELKRQAMRDAMPDQQQGVTS